MVEAVGVEPTSLKPSDRYTTSLVGVILTRLACHRQTAYASFVESLFILDGSHISSFLLAIDALAP